MNIRSRRTRRGHKDKFGGKFRKLWFKRLTKKKSGAYRKQTMRRNK